MFRPATRILARPAAARAFARPSPSARRFLSTAPPTEKSRSWKSSLARWGAAGAIVYYYNTSDVFAEEPAHTVQPLPIADEDTSSLPTIDALSKERALRKAQEAAAAERAAIEAQLEAQAQEQAQREGASAGSPQDLEDEAGQQGAFNPETGEINWDCPCLGGMASGPCGEEFKAAFSCFVYSQEEPKGMDCIDKFKGMQTCFRQYPEIYGSELDAEDEDDMGAEPEPSFAADTPSNPSGQDTSDKENVGAAAPKNASQLDRQARIERASVKQQESEELAPKAWHDASADNQAALKDEKK